ncbi:9821_t:CDS:2, partial [Gigaspora margarita]
TILLNSEGKPHVWKVFDISSERENHIEVIKKTELMMHELNENNITLCAIVTDSAGAYAAARRKLRMSYKSVVFLPCFAHQLNLCIGEIFKESTQFKTTIDRAIKLTNYFRNANHQFFIGQLRDIQYNTYKKIYSITAPGETRWNSFFYMCTSLMRTQKALEILAIKFKPPFTESRRRTGDNFIQREIYEIIISEEYNELEKEEIYEDNEELSISEEDFGEYLQGWAELLEEEQDNEDRVNIEDLDDIVHPALDKDAKWQLENLFVTLELPSH